QVYIIVIIVITRTSIYFFIYSLSHPNDLKLSFFSRSGTFKTIISDVDSVENQYITKENIERTKAENNDIIPLSTYLDWFKKELKSQKLTLNEALTAESLSANESLERKLNPPSKIA